jgi:uncharacterized membrane protein YuzA (DUF378 family)
MKGLHKVAFLLLVVGGVNWGLVGLLNFNLVMALFGAWPNVERLVYILVGLSAVSEAVSHMDICKECMMAMKGKK